MNITELARRIGVTPEELRTKLPDLGFSIGRRAIKVDDRIAGQIQNAWRQMQKQERLAKRVESQKAAGQEEEKSNVKRKEVSLPAVITVRDFAEKLNMPIPRVMQEMMRAGILASLNENIDFETAAILAADLGFEATPEEGAEQVVEDSAGVERLESVLEEGKADGDARPPVVVVMGHVDHGKTKLLDAIRETNVIDSEVGGITQHIGAYQVSHNDHPLTFIDTPGHEAFTVMRSRGAKVADLAILVVAADDGVQPQTREAIDIIKASGMPFVVALNKIDLAGADTNRVMGELAEFKLVPEDWGGDTVMVPISAKQGTNIDKLLEMLLLVADVHKDSIVADASRKGMGTIIDSHIDKAEGVVATVLVQSGTLSVGDTLGIDGTLYGKVRAMRDWNGKDVKEAPPSTPVKILGWKGAPSVGDVMEVPKKAKDLKRVKFDTMRAQSFSAMTTTGSSDEESNKKALPIIVKADVLGSLEALLGLLDRISHPDVGVTIVSRGLGNITDADIDMAEASGSVVYAFGVKPTKTAAALAREKNVELIEEGIIYKVIEDILERLQKLLPDAYVVTELGEMEVLANFRKLDNGWIIGGKMTKGKVRKDAKMRIYREDKVVAEGLVLNVQRGMESVKEVLEGDEFGLEYKSGFKCEEGDRIEFYEEEFQGRKLEIEGLDMR